MIGRLALVCSRVQRLNIVSKQSFFHIERFSTAQQHLTSNCWLKREQSLHTSSCLEKKKAKKEKPTGSKKVVDDFEAESTEELVDLDELNERFTAILTDLRHEFVNSLALRTSQAAFNNFLLEVDGRNVSLQYIAQVSMKNPHLVYINMASNPQYLPTVRDALQNSALNVNPRIEGSAIFIDTPRVTREHREKLSKSAKKLGDDHKLKIKEIQNKKLKLVRGAEKHFSIDDVRRLQDNILQLAKGVNKQIDETVKNKQKELLSEA